MEDPTEGEYPSAIRLVLIASDDEYCFWSREEVEKVRRTFMQRRGSVPTLQDLAARFDTEKLAALLQRLVQEKQSSDKLLRKLQATDDPCHDCGSTEALASFNFGLTRNQEPARDWSSTRISAAASAITLPLLGIGAVYGPGKSSTAELLRLQLKLCPSCVNARKGFFGGFSAKESDCANHPMWQELHGAGFTKFIGTDELKSWHQLP